jgi:F1F0 ATPase subunit 2
MVASFAVGVGLGAIFFGGLKLTVRQIFTVRYPALLALGSFVLRTVLVVAGFFWVGDGQWQRYAAALVGFVLARFLLMRLAGTSAVKG